MDDGSQRGVRRLVLINGGGTAETDFGQTYFGHPYFPTLAESDFGQFYCFSIFLFFFLKKRQNMQEQAPFWASKGGPQGWGRRVGPRRVVGPKFRAFSSFSRHRFALSVSLWGSSRGILVVF